MNLNEIMNQLEKLGTEQTRRIFKNHGSQEPIFGVKIGELKKISKSIKRNNELAIELYNTGNYDAMYLAGMIIDSKRVDKELLENWMEKANCYMLSEYTVPGVAAETPYALELGRKWMKSESKLIQAGGWSTIGGILSIAKDEDINVEEIKFLLEEIKESIHQQPNRVKYTMNGFIISAGVYVTELTEYAQEVAEIVGKVSVKMGKTSCKVPDAKEYIEKTLNRGKPVTKRKSTKC